MAGLIPGLAGHLKITRQAVGWFAPTSPESVRYGEFPVFIVEGTRGLVYGFPDFEGRGVKAAQHDHGPVARADEWDPPPIDDELKVVGTTLAELVPGAAGPIIERDICLYTNTLRADLREDEGNEFIIDR
jgi:sarcosine oxidase